MRRDSNKNLRKVAIVKLLVNHFQAFFLLNVEHFDHLAMYYVIEAYQSV